MLRRRHEAMHIAKQSSMDRAEPCFGHRLPGARCTAKGAQAVFSRARPARTKESARTMILSAWQLLSVTNGTRLCAGRK